MANQTLLLSGEIKDAAAIGNSSTVDKATLVRVYNDSGAVNVISVTDPTGVNAYSGVGSCTLAAGADIIIEKPADYTIWGKGQFAAAKVGFTN